MPMELVAQKPSLPELAPAQLLERIRRGSCVLLLGSGVAVDPARPGAPPIAVELAHRLASDPDVIKTGLTGGRDIDNPRYAAELFARVHDPDMLEAVAVEVLSATAAATTELHRKLATLPFTLCIDTCPCPMMERAFEAANKTPVEDHYNFATARKTDPPAGTQDRPLVYHLYGSVSEPDSLVLSESNLVDFLVKVIRNDPPLPEWMRGLLGRKNTEFLFLGFGFENWYLRVLLYALGMMEGHERPSYALEGPSFFQQPECEQTVGYFRRSGGGIKIQRAPWSDFAEQLASANEAARPPTTLQAPAPGMPLAFLSYASEDQAAVALLAQKLEERHVRVWVDRLNLQGGDRWKQALRHVIGKDVDYFVLVQSAALVERDEGVFNSELACALERQGDKGEGRRFVIPVTLDGRARDSIREEFHVVRVETDQGVDLLAKAILDDWAQRKVRRPAA